MPCATWCDLHYLKNVKNSHGGVLLLVILQAKACNFTTTNTPCLVLSMFFKLYKLYQVAKYLILFWNNNFYRMTQGISKAHFTTVNFHSIDT